jgi:VIT1/CCC1 family predicted Fe2+/Mn2+ transporter
MTDKKIIEKEAREPVLDVVDRISEMLFGLFMALTFVGAVSVATAGREEIRTMLTTAIGCNLAWGLVDAVMYLVRTITVRGRTLTLARSVLAATDPDAGRKIIQHALPPGLVSLVSTTEVEAMRTRLLALPSVPDQPRLERDDLLASLAIFLIVVASTFPVVLPFVFIGDVGTAKFLSRVIALAMLFFGGLAYGRYAGYGSWKAGLVMAGLGTGLVSAIMALGG